jgi:hypothetical protein
MTPDTRSKLAAAAELRAAGKTWAEVAKHIGRDPVTCRRWPGRYPDDWASLGGKLPIVESTPRPSRALQLRLEEPLRQRRVMGTIPWIRNDGVDR